jgi:hypothetical protein
MCLIKGLGEKDYRATDGFSSSELKSFATAQTPLHFALQKYKTTKSLALGSLAHIMCFEPHRMEEFQIIPGRRSKKDPANAIKEDDFKKAKIISDNVRNHPLLKDSLKEGYAEESAFWTDEKGHSCKARFDFRSEKEKIIFDLKTSQSSDPINRFGFRKFAQNFRYDIQAAHYIDGARASTGNDYRFLLIAVENEHPHTVSVCEFDLETLEEARREISQIKEEITLRRKNNLWEAWSPEVYTINFSKGSY